MDIQQNTPTKKVTINLPLGLIDNAMEASGANFTETVRVALEELSRRSAYKRLLDMQGKIDFGMTWQELKALDDE